jgi:hypothetical protein
MVSAKSIVRPNKLIIVQYFFATICIFLSLLQHLAICPLLTFNHIRSSLTHIMETSFIPGIRIKRLLDKNVVNREVSAKIGALKRELSPHLCNISKLEKGEPKLDTDGKKELDQNKKPIFIELDPERKAKVASEIKAFEPRANQIHEEIKALSNIKIRFNSDVHALLGFYYDEIVRELLIHGLESAKKTDKKMVYISNIRSEGVELLPCYPLISSLPSWIHPPKEALKPEGERKSLSFFVEQLCKLYTRPIKLGQDGKPLTEVVTKTRKDGTQYTQVAKVKDKDGQYANIKTRDDLRAYISQLLVELTGRLGSFIQIYLAKKDIGKMRTVPESLVDKIFELLLNDGQSFTEELVYARKDIPDPDVVATEKKKAIEAKNNGQVYKSPELPTINVLTITKTVKFNDDKFKKFQSGLTTRLDAWRQSKAQKPAIEAQPAANLAQSTTIAPPVNTDAAPQKKRRGQKPQ